MTLESMDVCDELRVNVEPDGRIWWDSTPKKWPRRQVLAEIDRQVTTLRARARRLELLAEAIDEQGRKP